MPPIMALVNADIIFHRLRYGKGLRTRTKFHYFMRFRENNVKKVLTIAKIYAYNIYAMNELMNELLKRDVEK
jgi:hypothetical protein